MNIRIKSEVPKKSAQMQRALKQLGKKKAQSIMRTVIAQAGTRMHNDLGALAQKKTGLSRRDAKRRVLRSPRKKQKAGWGRVSLNISQWAARVPAWRHKVRRRGGKLTVTPKSPTSAGPKWKGGHRFYIRSKFKRNAGALVVLESRGGKKLRGVGAEVFGGVKQSVAIDVDFGRVAQSYAPRYAARGQVHLRRLLTKKLNQAWQRELRSRRLI